MPLVHEKVAAFFGRPPSRSVHPDEAVAIGAALLAHSLGNAEGIVLIDVLPMSIGIGLPGGRVKTIIERNTPLPARKQYGLATTRDGQTEFELVVLQGELGDSAQCEYLGTLRLEGLPPGPRGMVKIAVTFELGAECLLTVTARELNSGRQVQATMSAREGSAAARRKLEAGQGDGSPPAPGPRPAGRGPATPPPSRGAGPVARPESSALGSFLRRLFGKEREAR
jgi:molecular chaperone DnaK